MHTSNNLFAILPIFLAASLVSAHGILEQVTIAGKTYDGPPRGVTGAAPGDTLARQVNDNGPVAGPSAATMACGDPGKPAALDAEAMPGDTVAFKWSSSWPHVVGPMMTYMANCNGDCTNFDASQAKWFKIDQKGFKSSGSGWAMADIAAGQPDTVTIPSSLKAGHYLVRNEMIATHNTPAEFYPACAQVKVGGSGTGVPSADELVSFPGGYSGNEPGLGSGYNQKAADYQFPGPALSSLAGSGGSSNPILVDNGGSSSSSSPAASSSPAVPAPSQEAPAPSPDAHVPAPSSDVPTPPADIPSTPSEAPAPPSQPSQGEYEHDGDYGSCRFPKHSRSRFIRSARPTATGAPPAEEAPVTPEAAATPAPANYRRGVHSRVMRRLAGSH